MSKSRTVFARLFKELNQYSTAGLVMPELAREPQRQYEGDHRRHASQTGIVMYEISTNTNPMNKL